MSKPRNSFEAVKFVLDHAPKDLTITQRAVLVQIAHHYPNPHLSQKTLAAEIGVRREDTINRAIAVLVQLGLLIKARQGVMRANKYELNYASPLYGQTVVMTTRQTVNHLYGQTVVKQTINKKENKERFFVFLKSFPNMTVDEGKVYRAYVKALTKGTSEDLLVAASQANREMLEPDAWLNFEKWKSYKPSDSDDWWGRAVND
jgi:DNA-binding XRE family transcriptional regulator